MNKMPKKEKDSTKKEKDSKKTRHINNVLYGIARSDRSAYLDDDYVCK
jgi:hypothetical protein